MKRAIVIAALMLAFAARAQDAAQWWNALASGGAAVNPMLVYARPASIVGFWHAKNSGGIGIQRTNTGVNSNIWADLSFGGHDLTLSGYAMNTNSGWGIDGSLICDGASGTVSGTYSLGNATNMTVFVVYKAAYSGFQAVFEHSSGLGTMGALLINVNDQGSIGRPYSEIFGNLNYDLVRDVPPFNVPDFSDDTVLMTQTAIINSGQSEQPYLSGYLDTLPQGNANNSVSTFDILSGDFKLGCRYSGANKLVGKIALLVVWDTVLSVSDVSNNVEAAKQQFGF